MHRTEKVLDLGEDGRNSIEYVVVDVLLHTVGLNNMEDRMVEVVGVPSDVRQQRQHDLDNDHNMVVVDQNDDWEDDTQQQLLVSKQLHIQQGMVASVVDNEDDDERASSSCDEAVPAVEIASQFHKSSARPRRVVTTCPCWV